MYIQNEYRMYQLAHALITQENFEIVHLNENRNEIWLEKYERNISQVVRLIHKGFDWTNHLKNDLSHTLKKVNAMRRSFLGRTIYFYNIYISTYTPVDDWNYLVDVFQKKQDKSLYPQMFYLAKDNFFNESKRLQEEIGMHMPMSYDLPDEHEAERFVTAFKNQLYRHHQSIKREARKIFSFGRPKFTYFLIAANVLMYFILEMSGSSMDIEHLINFGAKYNFAILQGEWWRIISSMFLHIGFLHIMMNMIALYYLGTAVERIYGSWRFLIIYFLAGIGGGLASFAFTINISAGASGAIFGLFGALLFFGLIHRRLFLQTMGRNLLFIIGFNIMFGFLVPQIDNGAHLGGLICGFIASSIVHLPHKGNMKSQIPSLILYVVIIGGLIVYGIDKNMNELLDHLYEIERFLD